MAISTKHSYKIDDIESLIYNFEETYPKFKQLLKAICGYGQNIVQTIAKRNIPLCVITFEATFTPMDHSEAQHAATDTGTIQPVLAVQEHVVPPDGPICVSSAGSKLPAS